MVSDCQLCVCHIEHQQPAVLQCEKHGEGETGPVWGREQRHSAGRLETPRAPQRLGSVRVPLRCVVHIQDQLLRISPI